MFFVGQYPYYYSNPYFYFYSGYGPYPVPYSSPVLDETLLDPYSAMVPFSPQPFPLLTPDPYDWRQSKSKDYGPNPFVINIEEATKRNDAFRVVLWTGPHLQLTVMSILVGDEIGAEIHHDIDQFIRIEEGQGLVQMGDSKQRMDYQRNVSDGDAIIIPAGKWHNIINTGNMPLKLYSIYAPAQHPRGTIQLTKNDALETERH